MKKTKKWFDAAIIKEDSPRTTKDSKHYILNSGTRKAVFSTHNLNYFDQTEQQWKEIDHRMKATDNGYQARFGPYMAKFSNQMDHETVEITNGGTSVSWEYLGTDRNVFPQQIGKSGSQISKRRSKLRVTPEIQDALKIGAASRAVYENAEGDLDIDYMMEGNQIKETLIVKEKRASYHYYFFFRTAGLRMEGSQAGDEIRFYSSGSPADASNPPAPEFVIQKPIMYDANGSSSEAVRYAMEAMSEGNYIFSIQADAEWINASDRVFPVYIDPQLSLSGSSGLTVSQKQYQWCQCCNGSCCTYQWVHTGNPIYSNYLYLYRSSSLKTTAVLHIPKGSIDLTRNKLISAKLIFQKYTGQSYSSAASIRIGNVTYSHYNANQLTANITSQYQANSGDFNLEMELIYNATRRFSKNVTLEIEYQPINEYPVREALKSEAKRS